MADYFKSLQYREDYTNMLKAILLLTKKMESISEELRLLRMQNAQSNSQNNNDIDAT